MSRGLGLPILDVNRRFRQRLGQKREKVSPVSQGSLGEGFIPGVDLSNPLFEAFQSSLVIFYSLRILWAQKRKETGEVILSLFPFHATPDSFYAPPDRFVDLLDFRGLDFQELEGLHKGGRGAFSQIFGLFFHLFGQEMIIQNLFLHLLK